MEKEKEQIDQIGFEVKWKNKNKNKTWRYVN